MRSRDTTPTANIFSDTDTEKENPGDDRQPAVLNPPGYVLVQSDILKAVVVIALCKSALPEIRAAHPHLTIWFGPEIDDIRAAKLSRRGIRLLWYTKKLMGGWVIPDKNRRIET